jgi:hypothetical protein
VERTDRLELLQISTSSTTVDRTVAESYPVISSFSGSISEIERMAEHFGPLSERAEMAGRPLGIFTAGIEQLQEEFEPSRPDELELYYPQNLRQRNPWFAV